MCNDSNGKPLKIHGFPNVELMTLEQLYLKCVVKQRTLDKNVDKLLKDFKAVLREECYQRLARLLNDDMKRDFGTRCIQGECSPFQARKKACEENDKLPSDKVGEICYWPDCPVDDKRLPTNIRTIKRHKK